jgi:hypothetical protein
VVVVSPDHDSGPGPLVAVPAGWTLERIVADDSPERRSQPSLTSADLLIVVGAPALGVRIAAATEARLMLADATERKIVLPQPGAARTRCVTLPGVALDGGPDQPVLTCLVCRSPHGDVLRVFSDDGRSSHSREVVAETGDPLDLRHGGEMVQPQPTPWSEPAQVVADGGGMVEAIIDAGRPQRARRVRLSPGAFRFTLIDRT